MAPAPPRLLVAWPAADLDTVRRLLADSRLPVLAQRLARSERLGPLHCPAADPLVLAVSLATGTSPADHRLLAPVLPAPDGAAWLPTCAPRWPVPPLWDKLAAAGRPAAVVGWPASHGSAPHPLRPLASDLDLVACDAAWTPLPPLAGCVCPDLLRVSPGELEPALLGFFIPAAELPAEPMRDPAVRALLRHLALLYSAHNTAITLLQGPASPGLLAVHYPLLDWRAPGFRRLPGLRTAALCVLDLLLGDLLRHAPGTELWLTGLAPRAGFLVRPETVSCDHLARLAPALLATFRLPAEAPAPPAPPPLSLDDDASLLRRLHLLGLSGPAQPGQPPRHRDLIAHQTALGDLLLAEDRPAEALGPLADAYFARPEHTTRALQLHECLHRLGLREEAREPAAALDDHARSSPYARLVEAELALRHLVRPDLALPLLVALLPHPTLGRRAAALHRETLLHLRRFTESLPLLETALAQGAPPADTQAGIAYARFHLGDYSGAASAARAARELGSARPQPARILAAVEALRAGQAASPDGVPHWETLIADAARRDTHRRNYATRRAAFLAARAEVRARQTPRFFLAGTPAVPPGSAWTLVTGAPRSGQALLLRMLAFGGLPILTDGVRLPDAQNPCGYFEWSLVARLASEPRLIDEAAGHALKIPAHLIATLPRDRRYRVLHLVRDPAEILLSQAGAHDRHPVAPEAADRLAAQVEASLAALRATPGVDLLEVPYAGLCAQPAAWAEKLAFFLGPELLPRPSSCPAAVRADLPRHRRLA